MYRKIQDGVTGLGAVGALLLSLLILLGVQSGFRAEAKGIVEVPDAPSLRAVAVDRVALDPVLHQRVSLLWQRFHRYFSRSGHPCAPHRKLFEQAATASGVPAALLAGVAAQESGRCGKVRGGWMQITLVDPASLRQASSALGVPWSRFAPQGDARQSVYAGAFVLKNLELRYPERIHAILAYNLGTGGLKERGGSRLSYGKLRERLPYRVRDYLPAVLVGSLWMQSTWEGGVPQDLPEDTLRQILGQG